MAEVPVDCDIEKYLDQYAALPNMGNGYEAFGQLTVNEHTSDMSA